MRARIIRLTYLGGEMTIFAGSHVGGEPGLFRRLGGGKIPTRDEIEINQTRTYQERHPRLASFEASVFVDPSAARSGRQYRRRGKRPAVD